MEVPDSVGTGVGSFDTGDNVLTGFLVGENVGVTGEVVGEAVIGLPDGAAVVIDEGESLGEEVGDSDGA